MKKTFLIFFTALLLVSVSSCKNDDVDVANVQFALNQSSFAELNFVEPIQITGSVTADNIISKIVFTGVKSDKDIYTAKGDPQEFTVSGTKNETINMDYFVDSKEMTHIEVKVIVGKLSKSTYISVGSVKGEAKGSAYFGEIMMKADSIVWNAENHPEVYSTPNTGAAANTPSFFSIHGVQIDGQVKHLLTGDEIRSVEGANGSFSFLNVLQNTSNKAYIGSQRGYMFSNLFPSQLGGGTTGRQCDIYEIGGKAIRQAKIDTTQFKIIAGSWMGTGWNEPRYKFVDSLFLVLGNEASTEMAKMKAYYQLGKIQSKLDNATLGEEKDPTNLGAVNFARRRTDAGTSGTAVMTENFRAGDYIILKNVKGGKLYYGIMQIVQIYDDSQAFVNVPNVGQKIGQEEAKTLFQKPLILNVKVQTKL
jgi:hypothetical protein